MSGAIAKQPHFYIGLLSVLWDATGVRAGKYLINGHLQIMAAERDFLETKFKRAASRQEELIGHIQVLRRQLLSAGLRPEVAAARLISSDQPNSATEESIDAPDEKIKYALRLAHP